MTSEKISIFCHDPRVVRVNQTAPPSALAGAPNPITSKVTAPANVASTQAPAASPPPTHPTISSSRLIPIAVEFYPQTHGQDDRATSESAVQKINGHWYQSDKPVGAILVGWAIKHKIVISTEQVQILRELLAIVGLRHSQA
ncbi:MAG: hypothetical protein B9S26_10430 [Opitutia bacterium Tous-C4FEB]|nr:MAG: hypothetical protein B9S35_09070 [Opitutae bacterium Tous-C5TDCM]PAW88738.1 MAG: hypothetical protein B9S26_10430 [Opitutae bacterium Tous-C4FEB]